MLAGIYFDAKQQVVKIFKKTPVITIHYFPGGGFITFTIFENR